MKKLKITNLSEKDIENLKQIKNYRAERNGNSGFENSES